MTPKAADLHGLIQACAETFRRYEINHRDKAVRIERSWEVLNQSMEDSEEKSELQNKAIRDRTETLAKADVNRQMAERCEEMLAILPSSGRLHWVDPSRLTVILNCGDHTYEASHEVIPGAEHEALTLYLLPLMDTVCREILVRCTQTTSDSR